MALRRATHSIGALPVCLHPSAVTIALELISDKLKKSLENRRGLCALALFKWEMRDAAWFKVLIMAICRIQPFADQEGQIEDAESRTWVRYGVILRLEHYIAAATYLRNQHCENCLSQHVKHGISFFLHCSPPKLLETAMPAQRSQVSSRENATSAGWTTIHCRFLRGYILATESISDPSANPQVHPFVESLCPPIHILQPSLQEGFGRVSSTTGLGLFIVTSVTLIFWVALSLATRVSSYPTNPMPFSPTKLVNSSESVFCHKPREISFPRKYYKVKGGRSQTERKCSRNLFAGSLRFR